MSARYYVEFTNLPEMFRSEHRTGWMVFDRERLAVSGDAQPIVWAINRDTASRTCDALNEYNRGSIDVR